MGGYKTNRQHFSHIGFQVLSVIVVLYRKLFIPLANFFLQFRKFRRLKQNNFLIAAMLLWESIVFLFRREYFCYDHVTSRAL